MTATFKLAELRDMETLIALMRDLYGYDQILFDEQNARIALSQFLSAGEYGIIWIIQIAGQAVGYIVLTYDFSLEFHGRTACLDELFICEEYRNRGVGQQALQFVEDYCRASKIKALFVITEKSNKIADHFYQKCGFAALNYAVLFKRVSDQF